MAYFISPAPSQEYGTPTATVFSFVQKTTFLVQGKQFDTPAYLIFRVHRQDKRPKEHS
jgi:hypothetical protein